MSREKVIVFDLEWNGGWGEVRLNEILQIGAVSLDGFGGPVTDTFRAFVKPAVHRGLNAAAKALAFSKAELAGGAPFAVVLERFLAWCGKDCLFASWGPHDLKELRDNAAFWSLDVPLPEAVFDLQAAAGTVVGAKRETALSAMAEYFGLPDSLEFHDALNDAFYTAMIGRSIAAMGREDIIRACRRSSVFDRYACDALLPQKLYPYVIHTDQRHGGFAEELAVLNHRGVRRQSCPECGRPLNIARWYPLGERGYLAGVACPEHGRQYFWAALSLSGKGTWRGKVRTLKAGPDIHSLYRQCDKERVILCKRSGRRKRKTRRGRNPQAPCENSARAV